jgi:FkbM family methyltransferase
VTEERASAQGVTLGSRVLAAVARPVLAGGLRTLPYIFGERGRGHAQWRSSYWIPSRLNDASTSVRARRDGIVWNLDLRDMAQRSLYYTGHYERSTGRLLADELKPGDVFVDIGAHIGIHALPAAKHLSGVGGRVFAFEPGPDSIAKIEVATKGAGLTNCTVVPTALGRAPGTVELHAADPSTLAEVGMRSVYGSGDVIDSVPVVTFDSWAEETGLQRLDVVKIDVEGSELDVLLGMEQCLRSLRPRLVIIEVIDELLQKAGSTPDEVLKLMADCGYGVAGETARDVLFRPETPSDAEQALPAVDH